MILIKSGHAVTSDRRPVGLASWASGYCAGGRGFKNLGCQDQRSGSLTSRGEIAAFAVTAILSRRLGNGR